MGIGTENAGLAVEGTRTVIGVLRERTRSLHERVEAGVDLGRSLGTAEGYARLLAGYLGLYRPFERALADGSAAARELVLWPERTRVGLLEEDLRGLGWSAAAVSAVPDAAGLPDLRDADAMLGALYVIEGSQLGGQYIFREVQSKLQLDAGSGAAFFYGDGEGTGRQWKRFLAGLEVQVVDAEVAAETAAAMFGYFEQGLAVTAGQREMA